MSDETNSVPYRSVLMKRTLIFITLVITMSSLALGQIRRNKMQEELLRLEKEFAQAIVKNDVETVGRFLADDWIIIDPDGGIIDKSRFLGVIKSGALTHEMMESDDIRVRIYGDTAVVTGLTTTKGKFSGQAFTTQERTTDVIVKQNGRWQYVFSQLTRFTMK
jgi:ketosteroid isomerase-like protein